MSYACPWSKFLSNLPVLLLIVFLINLMAISAVLAEPINAVEITGDGVANPTAFTLPQLQEMEQYCHAYSVINTWPTKKWYTGQGVKLRDLLDLAGIKPEAQLINFISSDGYEVTLTVEELLKDRRYYFPNLKDNDVNDGSVPGSPAGAQEVEPILALLSSEGDNPEEMNDMNSLMLIIGQRAVTEQTNNLFLKYVQKIEVLTTSPEKWDKPVVSTGSGEVPVGTLLELSNKASDADKIYYTIDGSTPTINSPMFNWTAKRWWSQRPDSLNSINRAIEVNQDMVVKAITIGPGKEDSDVVVFTYRIGDPDIVQTPGGPPTGVSLDEEMLDLKVGATFQLAAAVGPDNAIDKSVTWSSSDTSVATVDNYGLVTVVGEGTADIIVKTVSGDFTDTCTVSGMNKNNDNNDAVIAKSNLTDLESQAPPVEQQESQAGREESPEDSESVAVGSATDTEAQESPDDSQSSETRLAYLAAKETAAGDAAGSSQPQIGQTWRVFEVTADPVPLPLEQEQSRLYIYMEIIFSILFLLGAGRKYKEFAEEVAS